MTHPNCVNPNIITENDLQRCTACGAFQRFNPESGNLTWVRAGRVIAAADDLQAAKQRHDERYGTDHASS
jgi:hypothetical protein